MQKTKPLAGAIVIAMCLTSQGFSQTKIDLLTQTKGSVDFSAAPTTRPLMTCTTLPETCQAAEMFFKSDAPAGSNLYGCTASNTWTVQAGASGAVNVGGDLTGTSSSATVVALRNRSISTTAPTTGQVLTWNGSAWTPQALPATTNATQLQGRNVSGAAPVTGQVLGWDGSSWTPQSQSAGSSNATQLQGRSVSANAPVDGQSLVWSASAGAWIPTTVSGSGGSSATPFQTVLSGATTMQIGSTCSAQSPCVALFGNTSYQFSSPATATISGGAGTAFVYISATGTLTVGHSMTVNCSGCTAQSGVTSFPADSIPLYSWTASSGQWNGTGGSDWRSALTSKVVTAGTGLIRTDVGGTTTVSVDTAAIGLRVAVPSAATSACTAGSYASDSSFYYSCVATNTWRRAALSSW